ncbi:hypothetical protein Plec18167_001579 [Paecilomyces lecythidis]|uniref:Uncharacterized protein n=1 Tax=Paecilomyces lecythidis TaxID=3004212 RepID=A0ABR3YAS9_9EURO
MDPSEIAKLMKDVSPPPEISHIQSEWETTATNRGSDVVAPPSADNATTSTNQQSSPSDSSETSPMWTGQFTSEYLEEEEEEEEQEGNERYDPGKDILQELAPTSSVEYWKFKGPQKEYIQFILPNEIVLPHTAGSKYKGASVQMGIFGAPVAAKIIFDVIVRNAENPSKFTSRPTDIVHTAKLEFDLHSKAEVSNLTYERVFPNGTDNEYGDLCYLDIKFSTRGGVSNSLKVDTGKIDHAIRDLLNLMYTFTSAHSQDRRELCVRILVDPERTGYLDSWIDFLQSYSKSLPRKRAWFSYRRRGVPTALEDLTQRRLIKDGWNGSICPVPAVNHFHDIGEGIIKLAYGAVLDWQVGNGHFKRLRNRKSQAALVVYGCSTVYAVVKVNEVGPSDRPMPSQSLKYKVPDGTRVEMMLPMGEDGNVTCRGIVVPDYANVNAGDLYVAIYDKAVMGLKNLLSKPNETLHFMKVQLKFEECKTPMIRQIYSLARLDSTPKWHGIFLNHDTSHLHTTDPFHDLDPEKVQMATGKVLKLKPWNDQQVDIIKSAGNLKAGFGLIEGFPGCGKSTTLAALVLLYHLAGLHVLITGPSNASVDAITEKLVALTADVDYIRVRQAQLEGVSPADSAGDDGCIEDTTINADTITSELLQEMNESHRKRISGDPRYTVFAHVRSRAEAAVARNEKLLIPVTGIETFDAYSFFCAYISNPPQRPSGKNATPEKSREWNKSQTKLENAYKKISEAVVADAKIVACTDNLAGTELVRKKFATGEDTAKGIIVIADEDGQALETNAWIPLVSLDKADLVRGSIRGGDRHQLRPLVTSSSGKVKFNEFSGQLERSLFDRLLQCGFPVKTLNVQHRMHSQLASFPSQFTYSGSLLTSKSIDSRQIRPALREGLKTWIEKVFKYTAPDSDLHLIAIDVQDGDAHTEPRSSSRFNAANVTVVINLLSHLFDSGALGRDSDLTIITPYAEQRSRYIQALVNLATKKGSRWADMVKVATIDSMQGHECECVILDWVVSSANSVRSLGFTMDDNRCNVALTRAKQCLIVVGRGEMASSSFVPHKRNKQPQVVAHWQHLFRRDKVFDVNAKDFSG